MSTTLDKSLRESDRAASQHVFGKIVEDLSLLLDRLLVLSELEVERSPHKVPAPKCVHIAFRLGVTVDGVQRHGALLVPLAEAISMACYLMMMADDVVAARRKDRGMERATKDALVEVGNLIGGSIDCALRETFPKRTSTRSEGCQGLKAGFAPAFAHAAGEELVLARATLALHEYPPFDAWLMLPVVPASLDEAA
jgi:hypothetical protein